MSQKKAWEEIDLLAAALCDGEMTAAEAARLEALALQSPEARRRLLLYLQLHGELYWEHAASVEAGAPAAPGPLARSLPVVLGAGRFPRFRPMLRWAVVAMAVGLLVAAAWWSRPSQHLDPRPAASALAAQLIRSVGVQWKGEPKGEGARLASGETLRLAEGLVEVTFGSGARLILEGPAQLELQSSEAAFLDHGSLVAHLSDPTRPLTIRTPRATVVDLGTEFGVAALPDGPSEVHVFAGAVRVRPEAEGTLGDWQTVSAGEAVRLPPVAAGQRPRVEAIPTGNRWFARTLPPRGAGLVAEFRRLVRRHPHLIHHYTFEGLTPHDQRQDKRGSLHLTEVVMQAGRGGGRPGYAADGWDPTSRAIRPYRGVHDGNTHGVALQSEAPFHAPRAMTVELLVRFSVPQGHDTMPIACAVATREDRRRCGFFLVAVEHGQLTHLMDGEAPWVTAQDDFAFLPEEWYYVVSTFAVQSEATRINTYVANLSRGERNLTWIVRNQLAPGTPPSSRLGIGKGFDGDTAHAYPWSGTLDEIAIYDAILERKTMEAHLAALVGSRP